MDNQDSKLPLYLAGLLVLVIAGLVLYYGVFSNWQSRGKEEWKAYESSIQSTDAELHTLSAKIDELHGDSKCTNTEQCRVVGLGAPACGLYKNFLIYSTLDTQEADLLKAVAAFNEKHKKFVDLSLSVGDCGNKPAPVECISRHCEALQK